MTSIISSDPRLVVWPYEGIYIGIGNVFNPTQNVAKSGVAIGQVNMVLGWSADGRRWKWLLPDKSFVPHGSANDFDSCGVFGAKQDPLRTVVNDTLRLYYTVSTADLLIIFLKRISDLSMHRRVVTALFFHLVAALWAWLLFNVTGLPAIKEGLFPPHL